MASLLIVTPKDDEWRAACHEFGATPTVDYRLPSGTIVCRTQIAGRSAALAVLSQQTNTQSGVLTMELLYRENPRQAYLLGTALGEQNTPVGSIIVAERILDISERRPSAENPAGWKTNGSRAPFSALLLSEARNDIYERLGSSEARRSFFEAITPPSQVGQSGFSEARKRVLGALPQVAVEPLLSGNEYFMTKAAPRKRDKFPVVGTPSPWSYFPGNKAYDMEAAGFSLAADSEQIPWLVVRGVSDHGTAESKLDRGFTTQAAARYLRQFLESDPSRIDRISSRRPRLAGSLAEGLSGEYWGFMGYIDDDGHPVVYAESVELNHVGERVRGESNAVLRVGTKAAPALTYAIEIAVGARDNGLGSQGNFAGIWSPSDNQGRYFGTISGLLSTAAHTVTGTWTGTHKEGVRIGNFAWYSNGSMENDPGDIDVKFRQFLAALAPGFVDV